MPPLPRSLLKQVCGLPRFHQVLFCLSFLMLVWQGLYLARFFGTSLHRAVEVPVSPPTQCGIEAAVGAGATGMGAGQVLFRVDMRCTRSRFDRVFVTTPICGECGPEGWNTLSDEDGDGIYEGLITFTDAMTNKPLLGTGILYRYGISFREGSDAAWVSYPENLLAAQLLEDSSCAPASDGMTYAYRVLITDGDGTEARDVFGTCSPVPIPDEEWAVIKRSEWEKENRFLSEQVDPWWKPLSKALSQLEVFDPILFLTFCTLLYVYSVVIIGTGYVYRNEHALKMALDEAKHKNTYLEHAAKILRHDMHSGINTYIPRGIRALERRLNKDPETIEKLRLAAPLRMLKEGLKHTQKVYSGVTEFTNLVKAGAEIAKEPHDLRQILTNYLDSTSYKSEVVIGDLTTIKVNAPLFCTAIDNLVRNGLKYNDSDSKMVALMMLDDDHLGVMDNGRGMTQEDFLEYSKPYIRKSGQKESGSGLGLNICIAILHEHGFTVAAEVRSEGGTTIKVKIR